MEDAHGEHSLGIISKKAIPTQSAFYIVLSLYMEYFPLYIMLILNPRATLDCLLHLQHGISCPASLWERLLNNGWILG